MPDGVVDAFGRAALGMASWSEALGRLAEVSGAHVGQIAGIDRAGSLIANHCHGVSDEQVAEFVATGGADPRINARTRAVMRAPLLQTVAEADFGSYDMLRRHPYYTGFFARHDVPYASLTRLIDDKRGMVALALLRSESQGHLTDRQRRLIDRLATPIRDAISTGLLLERQKLDLLSGTLDRLAVPAFALNGEAQLVAMSPRAEQLLAEGIHLTIRRGVIQPRVAEHRSAFAAAVRATRRDRPALDRAAERMLLTAADGSALPIEIAPLPADCETWLHTACCLLLVRSRSVAAAEMGRHLAQQYRLTPSERAVALELLEGNDARTIALARNVSEGTVRNQIKAVLAKTGHRRQIDLVAALKQ